MPADQVVGAAAHRRRSPPASARWRSRSPRCCSCTRSQRSLTEEARRMGEARLARAVAFVAGGGPLQDVPEVAAGGGPVLLQVVTANGDVVAATPGLPVGGRQPFSVELPGPTSCCRARRCRVRWRRRADLRRIAARQRAPQRAGHRAGAVVRAARARPAGGRLGMGAHRTGAASGRGHPCRGRGHHRYHHPSAGARARRPTTRSGASRAR